MICAVQNSELLVTAIQNTPVVIKPYKMIKLLRKLYKIIYWSLMVGPRKSKGKGRKAVLLRRLCLPASGV